MGMLFAEEVAAAFAQLRVGLAKAEESIKVLSLAEQKKACEARRAEAEQSKKAEAAAREAQAARDAQAAAEDRAAALAEKLGDQAEEVRRLHEQVDGLAARLEEKRRPAKQMETAVGRPEAEGRGEAKARLRFERPVERRASPAAPPEEGARGRESPRRGEEPGRGGRPESRAGSAGQERARGGRAEERSPAAEKAGRQLQRSHSPHSRREREAGRTPRCESDKERHGGCLRSRSRSLSRHPPWAGGAQGKGKGKHDGGGLCFLYILDKCQKGDACRDRHPEKHEAKAIRERMERTPCRYGAECRRRDCIFKHPDDRPRSSDRAERAASPAASSGTE